MVVDRSLGLVFSELEGEAVDRDSLLSVQM
jgi:hypothetical protein